MFTSLQQTLNENGANNRSSSSSSSTSSSASSSSSLDNGGNYHKASSSSSSLSTTNTVNANVELTPSSFLFLNDSATSCHSNGGGYYDFGIAASLVDNESSNGIMGFSSASVSGDAAPFGSQILSKSSDPFMSIGLSSPLMSSNGGAGLITSPFGNAYASSLSSGSCHSQSSADSSAASSHNDILLNSIFQHEQHLAANGKLLNDSGVSSASSSFHHTFAHNPLHESLSSFYYAQNHSSNVDAN